MTAIGVYYNGAGDFGFQVDGKCKPNSQNNLFGQSHHLHYVNKKPQSTSTAVVWFNRPTTTYNSGSLLTSLKSIAAKPDHSLKTSRSDNSDSSNSKGLPSAEQLNYVFERLGENVSMCLHIHLPNSID